MPNPERDGGTLLVEDRDGQLRHATAVEARLLGALSAANEAMAMERRDAERYRWLRRFWVIAEHVDADGDPLPREEAKTAIASTGDSLDYLIDAALADRQGAGGEGG